MTTTQDQQGNLHRAAGSSDGGQFAEKSNSRPASKLAVVDRVGYPTVAGLADETVVALAAPLAPRDGQTPAEAHVRFARVGWSVVIESGDRAAHLAIEKLGPVQSLNLLIENPDDLAAALVMCGMRMNAADEAVARWKPRVVAKAVIASAEACARHGIKYVTPEDGLLPAGLADLEDAAPIGLYTKGDPERLAALDNSVAIVGARGCTGYGERITTELAGDLARAGVTIVAGGAYGVDAAAHRAALAAGHTTVAFLAGGLDRYYPAGNHDLLDRVAATGLTISEVPPGVPPTRVRFIHRNRLIAAATRATIVTEAGNRSGALNIAAYAEGLVRPRGAVPGPVTSPSSAGSNRLIAEGHARLVASPEDVQRLIEDYAS